MTDELEDIIPTLESLSEFKDISNPRFIGEGGYGDVYLLNRRKSLAGKVLFASDELRARFRISELQKEFEICKHLYENGVSVPKPEGVYRVSLDFVPSAKRALYGVLLPPVFVMEYVSGLVDEQDFSFKEKDKAIDLMEKELDKASGPGYTSGDVGFGNFIYQPEQEKVVLIDFGLWERTS